MTLLGLAVVLLCLVCVCQVFNHPLSITVTKFVSLCLLRGLKTDLSPMSSPYAMGSATEVRLFLVLACVT